jgi:lysophospholipid acyltransferase
MELTSQAYEGLLALEGGLADSVGLPEDQVRLVLLVLAQVPLCLLLQVLPAVLRLHFSNLVSVTLLLHLFGDRLLVPLAHALVVYVLTRALPRCGRPVFVYSLVSMSLTHLHRMWVDYGGWKIDISTVLMIYVCKFTYFGYNVQDGRTDPEQLTPEQQQHRLTEAPSLFMFLSYLLFLPCNILGPVHEYHEFALYIARQAQFAQVPFGASLVQCACRLGMAALYGLLYMEVHLRRFPLSYFQS